MKFRCLKMLASMGLFASACLTTADAEAVLASVKSTGMAGTAISYPIDALSGAYNPAGMVHVGDRFDLGAYWIHYQGGATISGNANPLIPVGVNGHFDAMRTKNTYNGDFGINKSFCTDFCGDTWEWSLGLVLYNRNYTKTTYDKPLLLLGPDRQGMEYVNETLSPMLSIKLNECHSVGVSFNCQFQRLKVNGLENAEVPVGGTIPGTLFPSPLTSVNPSAVTDNGYSKSWGWGFTLGWRWQVMDELAVGVTYQPKTSMGKFHKYSGFLAQHGKLDIPQKIGFGLTWNFMPCAVFCFDLEHIQWDNIRSLHNKVLHDGVLEPLGSKNGPGFGFRNQLYIRFGLEYQWDECWTFRAGYRHVNAPFKGSQTAVNLLTDDCVEDVLTLGTTWNFDDCNEISVLYAHGFDKKISGSSAIPAVLGGGGVSLKESLDVVGLAWGHKF